MRKGEHYSDRGQILIIFVFAIIGLLAIVGLAIDGGNAYVDRRNAQNVADSAALGAAVLDVNQQKAGAANCTDLTTPSPCGGLVKNRAMDIAYAAGFHSDLTNNVVEVHIPPIDGPYATCSGTCNPNDYLQVIIRTNVNTLFARVVGVNQLHNQVEAVALAKFVPAHDLYGGASLVQLADTGCEQFQVGGTGQLTLNGGGIFINSNCAGTAFYEHPCKTDALTMNGGAWLQGVGGGNVCPGDPAVTHVSTQYAFLPDPLIATTPVECSQAPAPSQKVKGVTTYFPGHYIGLPSGKLSKGVYCLDDFKTVNKDNADGTAGVLIYVKPSGSISIDGGTFNLVAQSDGAYQGIVIYYYPPARTNCKINGGSVPTLTGLVFIPNCDVKANGTSDPTGITAQIVAASFDFTGTNNFFMNGPGGKIPQIPEIDKVGLFH